MFEQQFVHQKEGHIVPVIVTLGIQSPPEHGNWILILMIEHPSHSLVIWLDA